MAGIIMSKDMKKALPPEEQDGAEDLLWAKSKGACFLCGAPMNRAFDIIEVDHDTPSSAGGEDRLTNLNLVHKKCNRFKRNHPSVNVRPYLTFEAFVASKGSDVKYDGAMEYFNVAPSKIVVEELSNGLARFELPDGTTREVPIYEEKVAKRTVRFTYVDIPKSAITNDDECQPRTIKLSHLWSILSDLQINPLHEPPACRLKEVADGSKQLLLMFDGQHKAVASWLKDATRLVVKVYFEMTTPQAIVLVNSIQSKIKKLPLSPFEFNAKLSDEWEQKLSVYEDQVGSVEASEAGFLQWIVDPAERRRATEAFKAAVADGIVSDSTLEMRRLIGKPGKKSPDEIPEAAFKSKVLQNLLYLKPLSQKGEAMRQMRDRESRNVVHLLNLFTTAAFDLSTSPSPQEMDRVKRMKYQASLGYVSTLLKKLVAHVVHEDAADRVFIEKDIDPKEWDDIEKGITNIVSHPIWTMDLNHSTKTRAVEDALSKNQNVEEAFRNVHLKLGHALGEKLAPSDLE